MYTQIYPPICLSTLVSGLDPSEFRKTSEEKPFVDVRQVFNFHILPAVMSLHSWILGD